jgi:hypothetical protein
MRMPAIEDRDKAGTTRISSIAVIGSSKVRPGTLSNLASHIPTLALASVSPSLLRPVRGRIEKWHGIGDVDGFRSGSYRGHIVRKLDRVAGMAWWSVSLACSSSILFAP